jgi:hypothetical protein
VNLKILSVITVAGAALALTAQAQTMDHAAHMKMVANTQQQSEVSRLGKDVMPFTVAATTHIFALSKTGGGQQVVAKSENYDVQIKLIRQHLQESQAQFLKGDFSGPSYIHGQEMPGLAELKVTTLG